MKSKNDLMYSVSARCSQCTGMYYRPQQGQWWYCHHDHYCDLTYL